MTQAAISDWKITDEAAGAPGYLTIDLKALGRNYDRLCALVAPARVAAIVKADAYGIGAEPVARTVYARGCRDFFVAQFNEAVLLRPALAGDARIFVLNGLQPGNEDVCARQNIVPVINSLEQWKLWSDTVRRLNRILPAVVQFDTGMSRLGIPPEEREAFAGEVAAERGIDILFVMSHLASADEPENLQNADQLAEFGKIAAQFPGIDFSFANSGGVGLGAAYHGLIARPGIALYGGAFTSAPLSMEPVVHLDVAVVQTRTVPAGARVGYSATHITREPRRLATIAAGYADGLPRSLSDKGAVYYDGIRLPIVGRVSMDSITIDISALPEGTLGLGSRVEVFGPHQTVEDVARDAGTISYEILTGLGQRYQRHCR
ncbi:alanine racemase [Neorhizobium alkalisoli]|uniref:Alanine racemase n=1 Tax=Neorhizobium alkalisoli TaxID=528178 RepID=A0A561R745_9HYPH|nr:alanine racemase [Neorhizobium alkalisoli]TWF58406.1 alanine racemase [Neorhizobium alkalisoli]